MWELVPSRVLMPRAGLRADASQGPWPVSRGAPRRTPALEGVTPLPFKVCESSKPCGVRCFSPTACVGVIINMDDSYTFSHAFHIPVTWLHSLHVLVFNTATQRPVSYRNQIISPLLTTLPWLPSTQDKPWWPCNGCRGHTICSPLHPLCPHLAFSVLSLPTAASSLHCRAPGVPPAQGLCTSCIACLGLPSPDAQFPNSIVVF